MVLDLHVPSGVVVRQRLDGNARIRKTRLRILKTIRKETKQRSIKLHLMSTQAVKSFFRRHGCETKHQIASTLVEWFEDLHWRLPPKRKPWQSEHHSMAVFDAAAAGAPTQLAEVEPFIKSKSVE